MTTQVSDLASASARTLSTTHPCVSCGAQLKDGRARRRYCSGRCRARASRERKNCDVSALLDRLQALPGADVQALIKLVRARIS